MVKLVDATGTFDDENSNITISVNNFNFTGHYTNEDTNEVRCKDILDFDVSDNSK